MTDQETEKGSLKDRFSAKKNSKQANKLGSAMKNTMSEYTNPSTEDVILEGEVILKKDCADIDVNPYQNRRSFDVAELNELANSIKENGQAQPIIVRPNGDRFQIVSGERRWRACAILGEKVDVVIRDVSPMEMTYGCYAENDSRKKIFDYEKSLTIKYLVELHRPIDEIVRRLNITNQDYYKLNKFQQMPSCIQDFLEKEPKALQRNEVAELFKLQKDLGGAFTPDMEEMLVDLLNQYVRGDLTNRAQIVKLFKKSFVTPKTRNRSKINQEQPLLWGDTQVGMLINTPTQMQLTIDKSEMDKETLEELQVVIMNFIESQK